MYKMCMNDSMSLHCYPLCVTDGDFSTSFSTTCEGMRDMARKMQKCDCIIEIQDARVSCSQHAHTHTFLSATQDTLNIVQPRFPLAAGIHSSIFWFTTNLKS